MTETVHIRAGGGIGDFIYSYFKKRQWKLLEPVKKEYPNLRGIAILTCHASSAPELLAINPHIDGVFTQEWFPPKHEKEKMWQKIMTTMDISDFAREKGIAPGMNKLYLNQKEQKVLAEIKKDKYIVFHPFAGLPHRGCFPHPKDGKYRCLPDYKYKEIMESLIKKDYKIVLLGRSERNLKGIRNNEEMFSISGPNIYNLVDQVSLRFSTEVTRQATGFIGSHSSMLSAAWTNSVPSIYFYPSIDEHGNKRSVKAHGGETGNWAMDRSWTFGYERTPDEFLAMDSEEVVEKITSLIRG